MPYYQIDLNSGKADALNKFVFKKEGGETISPQELLALNPNIIMDIPEIEVQSAENYLVAREYSTSRGPIDILIVSTNADIVIVETKLLKNPESQRTVVAQAIDYAKAFYEQGVNEVVEKLSKNNFVKGDFLTDLKKNEIWIASLQKNIQAGNFQVVILGDRIHPNVLGMVESIQSAPHMSFSISLVELDPFITKNGLLYLYPRIVSKTVEVERSVIRIQIDHEKKEHTIESETPDKGGTRIRPILTPQEFLEIVTEETFIPIIEKFWKGWKGIGGDIRFGVAGFSAGLTFSGKRMAPFFTFYNRIPILSEKWRSSINISDDLYMRYTDELKASQTVYDGYCVGNKVEVPFDKISVADLEIVYKAAVSFGKLLLSENTA